MQIVPIVSILSIFVIAPAIVFTFIFMMKRSRLKAEELRYKRDIAALELEKDKMHLQLLEAENAKYDRLIADGENSRKPDRS